MKCVVEKIKNLFGKKKTDSNESELRFHSLTPIDNIEDNKIYQDALEFALQQDAVKNIAVTGPYGSGKSSVIQSFFKNSPNKYKVITLSLASFRDCDEDSGQAEQQEQSKQAEKQGNHPKEKKGYPEDSKLQRLIEISLLQQLFYHEKDNKLPDSQFKKIKKQSTGKLIVVTALGILFILSLLYLLFPDVFKSLIPYDTTRWEQNCNWVHYIASVIFFCILSIILFKISRMLINISVKKLNLKTAEIEIGKKIDKSILNSHIDEIIYFFEATDNNVVVIEDLDRFEHSEIFVKLREINRLINNCDKIDRKITFIYALKDEVFADKDRTKFFDFILPIVPIINYSNSGEKLRACLQTEIAKEYISEDCIDHISLFVNDMRLLYNIVNEYYIYSNKVNSNNLLAHNELLSIIAYKNLHPKDFSDLAENKGVLFNAINKKGDLLMSQISSYNQKIEKLKERISEANKQSLKDVKELRTLYLSKIIENLKDNFISFVDDSGNIFPMSQCAEQDELFERFKKNKMFYRHYYHKSYYDNRTVDSPLSIDFKTVEKEVDSTASYEQRLLLIQDKNSIETIETQIRELEYERDSLYKKPLSEFWSEYPSDRKAQSKQEEIIDVFIRRGYINEHYNDYISIFHEGSLSQSDKQFIINVTRGVQSDMVYSLNHVENVFKKIIFYSFEDPCTLNVSLANHLFENAPDSKQTEFFIKQLANESQPSFEFLEKYIFVCTSPQTLFSKLCARWKNIWRFVSLHETTEDIKEQYYHSILKYAELQDAEIIFEQNEAIIANDPSFLKKNIDHTRILEIVKRLNIKFSSLNPNYSNEDFEFVRKNRHYVLTPENLKVLIRKEYWDVEAFKYQNYTYINHWEDKSILEYVNENLADYIRNVWLKLDSKREEEEYLIQLINSKNIDFTLKEQVVERVEVLIDNIEDIEDSNDWEIVFLYMKVRPSWENVRAYSIAKGGITGAVLSCVEDVSFVNQLVENKFPQEEGYKDLALQLISLKEISTNLYTKLVSIIPWKITEVPTDLPRENVQILIENDIVKEVIAAYESLKEHYTGLHIQLMLHYFEEFETRFEDLHFSSEDLRSILSVKSISDNQLQKSLIRLTMIPLLKI